MHRVGKADWQCGRAATSPYRFGRSAGWSGWSRGWSKRSGTQWRPSRNRYEYPVCALPAFMSNGDNVLPADTYSGENVIVHTQKKGILRSSAPTSSDQEHIFFHVCFVRRYKVLISLTDSIIFLSSAERVSWSLYFVDFFVGFVFSACYYLSELPKPPIPSTAIYTSPAIFIASLYPLAGRSYLNWLSALAAGDAGGTGSSRRDRAEGPRARGSQGTASPLEGGNDRALGA